MRHLIRLSGVVAAMATALLGAPAVLANADAGDGGQRGGPPSPQGLRVAL